MGGVPEHWTYPSDGEGNRVPPAGMLILKGLSISNYRLFEHLHIAPLQRINLIVGKNNSGKTCLLEALWLFARGGDPHVLWQILEARDESRRIMEHQSSSYDPAIIYLFHGMPDFVPEGGLEPIVISSKEDEYDGTENYALVEAGWYTKKIGNEEFKTFRRIESDVEYNLAQKPVLLLRIEHDEEEKFYTIDQREGIPPVVGGYKCIFVKAPGLDSEQTAVLWDRIALSSAEETITDALRVIEPGIKRVGMKGIQQAVPVLNMTVADNGQTQEKIIPLRNLGEGINRLFGIAVALANARNGLLLVDEIDGGLHYTVLVDMWRIILHQARTLNIQVFATTHNWECIIALQIALHEQQQASQEEQQQEDKQEQVQPIRLERKNRGIVPTIFHEHQLPIITRENIEVR